MQKQDIDTILASQRKFFATGKTLPVSWRLEQLKKLRTSMVRHEEDLYGALKKDLGKSRMESYMCEIGLTLSELTWMEKHIRRLTREKRVPTPLAQFAARSFQSPTPYGTVLIMSPWNYPVLLTLEPMIDALAAGNTVIVKPSAYAPVTSAVMEMIIRDIRMHWLILIKIMSKQRFSRESLEKELLNQKKYGMPVTMMIFI